jgi:hypothetical protein
MKSYVSVRPIASFTIAMVIGAYCMSTFISGGLVVLKDSLAATTPELYNSAFSPSGVIGGEIVPASCSMGYACDASDAFCPCSVPQITSFFPGNATTLTGGGNLTWGYTSDYAAFCDFSTTMSAANLGPSYYYVEDSNKTFNNFGPFANANGWVRYRIQCWDSDRAQSDIEDITINLVRSPEVKLLFGNLSSPFLNINSFTSTGDDIETGSISWDVNGATSCSATGPTGWANLAISLPTGSRDVYYSGSYPVNRTYTLTCTNGTETQIRSTTLYFEGLPTCGGSTGQSCN